MGHVVNPHLFRLNYVLFWSTSLVVKKKYSMYFEVNSVYLLKYIQNYFKRHEFVTIFRLYNSGIKLMYLNNVLKVFLLFNQSTSFKKILKKKIKIKILKNFKSYIKKCAIKDFYQKKYKVSVPAINKKKLINTLRLKGKLKVIYNKSKLNQSFKFKKKLNTKFFFLKKKKLQSLFFPQKKLTFKLTKINKIKHKAFLYKKKSRNLKILNFYQETKNKFLDVFLFKQEMRKKFKIFNKNLFAFPYPAKKHFFWYKRITNFFNFKNKFIKSNKTSFINVLKFKNLKRFKIPIMLNFNRVSYLKRRNKISKVLKKFKSKHVKKTKNKYNKGKRYYRFLKKILLKLDRYVLNYLSKKNKNRKSREVKKFFLNKKCIPIYYDIKKIKKNKNKIMRLLKNKKIFNVKKFVKKKYSSFKGIFNVKKENLLNLDGNFSRIVFRLKTDQKSLMINPAIYNPIVFVKRLHARRQALLHYKALDKVRQSYSVILKKKKFFRSIFNFFGSIYNYSQKLKLNISYVNLNKKVYLKSLKSFKYKTLKVKDLKLKKFKKVKIFGRRIISNHKRVKKKLNKRRKIKKIIKKSKIRQKKKFYKMYKVLNVKKRKKLYKDYAKEVKKVSIKNRRLFFYKYIKLKKKLLLSRVKKLNKNKIYFKKKVLEVVFNKYVLNDKWKYNANFIKNLKRKFKKSLKIEDYKKKEEIRRNNNVLNLNNNLVKQKLSDYKLKRVNFFSINNYAKNFINKFFSFFYYIKILKLKSRFVSVLNVLFNYKINVNILILIKKHWNLFGKSADLIADLFILKLLQKYKINAIMNSVLNYLNKCIRKKKLYGYAILIMGRFSRKDRATYSWYKKGPFSRSNKLVFIDYSNKRVALKFSTCSFKINLIKSLDYKEKKNEIL